jgi:predicted XRE-type DNA-binding protein
MEELNKNWRHLIHVCESRNLELEEVLFTPSPARETVWKELHRRGFTQTEIDRMFNVNQSPTATRTARLGELKDEQWVQLIRLMSLKDIASTLHSRKYSATTKRARIWKAAYKAGLQQAEIARAFNVSQQAVSKAVKRKQDTRL